MNELYDTNIANHSYLRGLESSSYDHNIVLDGNIILNSNSVTQMSVDSPKQ